MAIGLAGTVLAAVIGVGIAFSTRAHPAAAPVLVATASATGSSRDVGADEVVLELTADAPIDRVSAPGIHGAQVDGAHAKLVVARWGGELPIEAALEGGSTARAVAQSDGMREIRLLTVPAPLSVASSAPPAVAPPPAPEARPTPRPARPPPGPRPAGELQANPYGP